MDEMKKKTLVPKYRAIVTADWHLSNTLPHATPGEAGVSDRLRDQFEVLQRIFEYAAENQIQDVIVIGDLWDKRLLDAVTLKETLSFLGKAQINVWVLPGNHDTHSATGGRHLVEVLGAAGLKNLFWLSEPLDRGNWVFWPIPFMSVDRTVEAMNAAAEQVRAWKTPAHHFLLLHQSIIGARNLGWTCDAGLDRALIPDVFDHTFAGHFHEAQVWDGGEYVGAPWAKDFGEQDIEGRFLDVTFGEGTFDVKVVQTNAPRFLTVHLEGDEPKKANWKFVRVMVEASDAEWAELRVRATARAEAYRKEGMKAHVVRVPIYHHEERMGEGAADADSEKLISRYVESESVRTEGLKVDRLKALGNELLKAAKP